MPEITGGSGSTDPSDEQDEQTADQQTDDRLMPPEPGEMVEPSGPARMPAESPERRVPTPSPGADGPRPTQGGSATDVAGTRRGGTADQLEAPDTIGQTGTVDPTRQVPGSTGRARTDPSRVARLDDPMARQPPTGLPDRVGDRGRGGVPAGPSIPVSREDALGAGAGVLAAGETIRQRQRRNRRRIREEGLDLAVAPDTDLFSDVKESAEDLESDLFGGAREQFEGIEETLFEPVQEAAPTTEDLREGAATFGDFAFETSVGDETIFTYEFEEGETPETADLTVFTGPGPVAAFGGRSLFGEAKAFASAARGTRAAQAARIGRGASTGPVGGGGFGTARGFGTGRLLGGAEDLAKGIGIAAGAGIANEVGLPEEGEPTGPEGFEVPEEGEPTGPEGFDAPESAEPVSPVEFESPAGADAVFGPEVGVPEDAEPVTATELDVPDQEQDMLEIGAEPFLTGEQRPEELEEVDEEDELGVPDDPFRRSDERLFDPARDFVGPTAPLADVDPTEPGGGEAAEDIGAGIGGVGEPMVAGEEDITFGENMQQAVEDVLERQERAQRVDIFEEDEVAGEEEDLELVSEEVGRTGQAARSRLDLDVGADSLLAPDERAGELFGTGVDERLGGREDQAPDLDVPERFDDRLRFDADLGLTPEQGQGDDFLEPPENPPDFDFPDPTTTPQGFDEPFEPVNPTETVTEDVPGFGESPPGEGGGEGAPDWLFDDDRKEDEDELDLLYGSERFGTGFLDVDSADLFE